MNKLFLFFILIPAYVFGQHTKLLPPPNHPPTKAENLLADKEYQCFHSSKFSKEKRRSFSPFSTADTIKLISFKSPEPGDTSDIYTPIAPNHFILNKNKVIEIKTLSQNGIDSLTNILYNIGRTPVKNVRFTIEDHGSCYDPRNAILFINDKGVVTQYIEVCFECERYYLSSKSTKSFPTCAQKYQLLKNYFLAQGLKYGTVLPKRDQE